MDIYKFCGHLVYFTHFGMLHMGKSGNPGQQPFPEMGSLGLLQFIVWKKTLAFAENVKLCS
jgi:hypothetical protein